MSGTSISRLGVKNHIEWLENLQGDDDNDGMYNNEVEEYDLNGRKRKKKQQHSYHHHQQHSPSSALYKQETATSRAKKQAKVVTINEGHNSEQHQQHSPHNKQRRDSHSFGEMMFENQQQQNDAFNASSTTTTTTSILPKISGGTMSPTSASGSTNPASVGSTTNPATSSRSLLSNNNNNRASSSSSRANNNSNNNNTNLHLHAMRLTSIPLVNSVIEKTYQQICEFGKPGSTLTVGGGATSSSNSDNNNNNNASTTTTPTGGKCTFHAIYRYLISTATTVRQWDRISALTDDLRSEFAHYCSTRSSTDCGPTSAKKGVDHKQQQQQPMKISRRGIGHRKNSSSTTTANEVQQQHLPMKLSSDSFMTLTQFKLFLIQSHVASLFTAYQKAAIAQSVVGVSSVGGGGGGGGNKSGGGTTTTSASVDTLPYSYFLSSTFEDKLRQQNRGKTQEQLESLANEILAQPIQKVRPPNFSALEHNQKLKKDEKFTTLADMKLQKDREAVLEKVVRHSKAIKQERTLL